ncbi:unnamed protein product [Somion occarium]
MKKVKVADGSAVPVASSSKAAQQPEQAPDPPAHGGAIQEGEATKQTPPANAKRNEKKRAASGADGREAELTAKQQVRKLAPPRPFPTVPTSVSATGPRSAHSEGKNYICVTRKTPLGAYLRRCKDLILKDGYKSLHLSAMGAAIPHLVTLSTSLPTILPHAPEEIHTEILTGTVEVQDELIPDDEDEDISYRTRGKSTLMVIIRIGDGVDELLRATGKGKGKQKSSSSTPGAAQQKSGKGKQKANPSRSTDPDRIIIRAEDIEDMEE